MLVSVVFSLLIQHQNATFDQNSKYPTDPAKPECCATQDCRLLLPSLLVNEISRGHLASSVSLAAQRVSSIRVSRVSHAFERTVFCVQVKVERDLTAPHVRESTQHLAFGDCFHHGGGGENETQVAHGKVGIPSGGEHRKTCLKFAAHAKLRTGSGYALPDPLSDLPTQRTLLCTTAQTFSFFIFFASLKSDSLPTTCAPPDLGSASEAAHRIEF